MRVNGEQAVLTNCYELNVSFVEVHPLNAVASCYFSQALYRFTLPIWIRESRDHERQPVGMCIDRMGAQFATLMN